MRLGVHCPVADQDVWYDYHYNMVFCEQPNQLSSIRLLMSESLLDRASNAAYTYKTTDHALKPRL